MDRFTISILMTYISGARTLEQITELILSGLDATAETRKEIGK